MSTTTLHLAKQNFKFSAAHFLIFDATSAEKLHGHNYQVKVDIEAPSDAALASERSVDAVNASSGYFVDFNVFKKHIKSQLDLWDEHVLLPALHPEMRITPEASSLKVQFRERLYMFPENEVVRLPVTNTSVEQLSSLLAQNFLAEFKKYGVLSVRVFVEETAGQGASTLLHA